MSYMAAHEILRGDMAHIGDNGKKLEVSHLCCYGICVKPTHLVLETYETNWKEYPVKSGTVHKTASTILFLVRLLI